MATCGSGAGSIATTWALLHSPQRRTPSMAIFRPVSTQNNGFGGFPSSPIASPWKTMQIDIVGSFRARTGGPFHANFIFQHVRQISRGKIFSPTPSDMLADLPWIMPHDASWMIMHHSWSWIMHQWWSWIIVNHQWSCIIMHHGSWSIMDHHASCMIIHHHQPCGRPRCPGGWSRSNNKRETPIWVRPTKTARIPKQHATTTCNNSM